MGYELSLSARREITKKQARAYDLASKKGKGEILARLVGEVGWSRANARRQLNAARAVLAGISPIPGSSGMTSGRQRINHGGHRQLNAAIYRAVIVRMRFHQPTIDYVARRTAEGKSKRDIIRCPKRYVIREVYHLVNPAQKPAQIAS